GQRRTGHFAGRQPQRILIVGLSKECAKTCSWSSKKDAHWNAATVVSGTRQTVLSVAIAIKINVRSFPTAILQTLDFQPFFRVKGNITDIIGRCVRVWNWRFAEWTAGQTP